MPTVTIGPHPDGWASASKYDPRVIELAKQYGARWKPERKLWVFAMLPAVMAYAQALKDEGYTVLANFDEATRSSSSSTDEVAQLRRELAMVQRDLDAATRALRAERRSSTSGRGRGAVDAGSIEDFLRTFGQSGYRALTRAAHPDAGGSTDWQQRINDLWSRIEGRR